MSIEIIEKTSVKVAFSPFCNFKCEYCGGGAARTISPYPAVMEDYRSSPLALGILTTEEMTKCFGALASAGFKTIRPTGGEPTLNPEWDVLIDNAHKLGFSSDITTNGSQLNKYLDEHTSLPCGLSMVKVSMDTDNAEDYRRINGNRGDLKDVERAIERMLKLGTYVRVNTVLTREGLDSGSVKRMIKYSEHLGVQQIQLLDLVYYPNYPTTDIDKLKSNKEYWEDQFVAFPEFRRKFAEIYPNTKFLGSSSQFGVNFWKTVLPSGLVVTFKDSTVTMRDEKCLRCPVFCQEGRCLLRMGTDGNLTPCPDYRSELPDNFNVLKGVQDRNFDEKISVIKNSFIDSEQIRTIELFAGVHDLRLPKEV